VFPIHRSVRFVLTTATNGAATREIACRLGERTTAALESLDAETDAAWFPVRVTPALLARLTGPDLALPELTSPIDLTIAERAAALFVPLGDARGWAARFGRELNATDDRGVFQPPGRRLPVIEGKLIEPFHVEVAAARWTIARADADRLLGTRYRRWRLAYRDVASATNRLTLIAALLPPDVVSTHTIFCLHTAIARHAQHFLCGLLNSFVVNYLARLRVTTHVTTAIVERLPVPLQDVDRAAADEIAAIAAAMARVPDRMMWMPRLNALVAWLYQLTEQEFAHVLGTFPLVPRQEREQALREFQKRRV
jgi:hypothetical protein